MKQPTWVSGGGGTMIDHIIEQDKFIEHQKKQIKDLKKQNKDLAELAGLTERRPAFMEKKSPSDHFKTKEKP